jgi:uncharacterized protein YndB with AHSA1/START domain
VVSGAAGYLKMTKLFVDKTIEIHAPASKVWRVFTDPDLTRQMGGEYVSDWKVGSSFGFKGLDGTILKIEPEKLLQHKLFNSISSIDSVITYELQEHNGDTTLYSREEFTSPVSDKEYSDIEEGWNAALLAVKELAENI